MIANTNDKGHVIRNTKIHAIELSILAHEILIMQKTLKVRHKGYNATNLYSSKLFQCLQTK